ncbi:hypothetical protein [Sulfuracidifex tepidarius]|uniref:hypothetical protein n=1 Tax=Sulfuracidifex tepidarius TaxID=1294262 RepID=UPI0006D0A064|nr:hypothetical protein [Sulfuracidifex tepidarius]
MREKENKKERGRKNVKKRQLLKLIKSLREGLEIIRDLNTLYLTGHEKLIICIIIMTALVTLNLIE